MTTPMNFHQNYDQSKIRLITSLVIFSTLYYIHNPNPQWSFSMAIMINLTKATTKVAMGLQAHHYDACSYDIARWHLKDTCFVDHMMCLSLIQ